MGRMRILVGFVAVGLALTLMSYVNGMAQVGAMLTASGKIASVDPQQKIIRLKTGFLTTQKFVVENDTKITTNGQQPLDLEQIQPGAEATIQYLNQDGQQVAQAITVKQEVAAQPMGQSQSSMPSSGAHPSHQPSVWSQPSASEPAAQPVPGAQPSKVDAPGGASSSGNAPSAWEETPSSGSSNWPEPTP